MQSLTLWEWNTHNLEIPKLLLFTSNLLVFVSVLCLLILHTIRTFSVGVSHLAQLSAYTLLCMCMCVCIRGGWMWETENDIWGTKINCQERENCFGCFKEFIFHATTWGVRKLRTFICAWHEMRKNFFYIHSKKIKWNKKQKAEKREIRKMNELEWILRDVGSGEEKMSLTELELLLIT
jgi:hypothetical protein